MIKYRGYFFDIEIDFKLKREEILKKKMYFGVSFFNVIDNF